MLKRTKSRKELLQQKAQKIPEKKISKIVKKADKILKDSKLSDRMIATAHEYIKDWKIIRSMVAAGYSVNYANAQSKNLLENVGFRDYVEEIQKDIAKEVGISSAKIINELMKIAFSNVTDVYKSWQERKDFDSLSEEAKASIGSLQTTIRTTTLKNGQTYEEQSIKTDMRDKIKAIAEINKMLGFYSAKELKVEQENTIKLGAGSISGIREAFGL